MTTPKLRIVLPLRYDERIRDYCIAYFADHLPNASLSASFLLDSVTSTVSDYDQYCNAPWILKTIQAAIRDGVDGIFLGIAFDTALPAAKCLGVTVVGALEAAVAQARTLCRRFSILAINDEEVAVDHRLSREYDFAHMLASVETINIGVMELQTDPERTLTRLAEAGQRAIQAGAQAVILGCTAMGWAARPLAACLHVPVIDTNLIGLYMLDAQVRLDLAPSPLEYRYPSGFTALSDDEYEAIRRITFPIHRPRQ